MRNGDAPVELRGSFFGIRDRRRGGRFCTTAPQIRAGRRSAGDCSDGHIAIIALFATAAHGERVDLRATDNPRDHGRSECAARR